MTTILTPGQKFPEEFNFLSKFSYLSIKFKKKPKNLKKKSGEIQYLNLNEEHIRNNDKKKTCSNSQLKCTLNLHLICIKKC